MSSNSNASTADSTDSGVSDLIDAGYRSNSKLSVESRSLSGMSSVRNFGNVGTLMHGLNSSADCAVFKDCNLTDASLAAKQFYDRNSEYLKNDNVPWEDYVKVRRTNVATSESGASSSLSSTSAACKFIKDEKEPSVIMDTPCPSFNPSPEISALEPCCNTDSKQHLGLGEGESTSFPQIIAVPRPGLEGSPNYAMDLNQSEQLVNPVRTDSRCALSGKALINFDANTQSAAQQTMFKIEASRWQMQTSPAEPQFWCQSTGVTQEPFTASNYDGIQNQTLSQRNPTQFSGFPG